LGEVRAVLAADPAVRSAAVAVHTIDGDPATARIDAWVVLAAGTVADVRRRIAEHLPTWMLPAGIAGVEYIPVTANGKADLTALPRLGPAPVDRTGPAAADVTSWLQDAWAAALGVPVGPDDDFFELGGNSLLAVRINAAMRDRGLPAVPLRQLFRAPTPRAIAAAVTPTRTGSRGGT
jgi:hypothetical protein